MRIINQWRLVTSGAWGISLFTVFKGGGFTGFVVCGILFEFSSYHKPWYAVLSAK